MTEEIKEKLEAIASNDDIDLLWNEANDLLNYITNLQKEIENKDINYEIMQSDIQMVGKLLGLRDDFIISEEMPEKIKQLQQENEKLKEKVYNQKLANAYATIQIDKLQTRLKTYKRRKTAESQKKRIYKSRNEKGVEYFESLLKEEVVITDEDNINYGEKVQRTYFSDSELGKGINILEGGDE